MDAQEQTLLRALASAMHLGHLTALEAEQVNEVAAFLQLPLEEVPILVTRLQDEDLVKLHWGGPTPMAVAGVHGFRHRWFPRFRSHARGEGQDVIDDPAYCVHDSHGHDQRGDRHHTPSYGPST